MPIIGVTASSAKGAPGIPTIGTVTDVGTGRAFNNGAATVPFTPGSGAAATSFTVKVYSSGGVYQEISATGFSSPITITGLLSNTEYKYRVFASNASGNSLESGFSNTVTATTVPQAPTIGTATRGNASATVAYTAGATGGSAITTFTATSSPGSFTGTGTSPITVSGLSNGTAYTFTVTATNANGTSLASAASNSVTPAQPAATVWTMRTSNISTGSEPRTVVYGNGVFFTVGINLSTTPRRSTNGITWTTVTIGGTNFAESSTYGNGIFLISQLAQATFRSTDNAQTFSSSANTNFFSNASIFVQYGNGVFIATGFGGNSSSRGIRRSTDAITWTTINDVFPMKYTAYGNGIWLGTAINNSIYRSIDNGLTWTTSNASFPLSTTSKLTYGNGIFMTGRDQDFHDNVIRRSTDGVTWTSHNAGFATTSRRLMPGYGNGVWALAAYRSAAGAGGDISVSSDNGISWTTVNSNTDQRLWDITYGNGIWVAVGQWGRIMTASG